jgi:hypothetical protein
MTKDNLGRFRLEEDFVMERPDAVANIFRELRFVALVCGVHEDGGKRYLVYAGLSDAFKEVGEGEDCRDYELVIDKKAGRLLEIRGGV